MLSSVALPIWEFTRMDWVLLDLQSYDGDAQGKEVDSVSFPLLFTQVFKDTKTAQFNDKIIFT